MNPFARALLKTRQTVAGIIDVLGGADRLTFEDLEELLIATGFPPDLAASLVAAERERHVRGEDALATLEKELVERLEALGTVSVEPDGVTAILLVGVNGSGKTTSCARLANYLSTKGHRVLLCAADTFRAAGSEQLEVWADRLGLPVVSQERGAHPGAIIFDAVSKAISEGIPFVIADTAGRLHSKAPLMEELKKAVRSAEKAGATRIVSLLVVDAFVGINVVRQVEEFHAAVSLDGLIVTKIDGSSKAGAVLAASLEHGVPIAFVGTGEGADDFEPFDARAFVSALFEAGRNDIGDDSA